tara:strand:+ start:14 stop:592 length:579 start_codon:yes stop_codon:yes gene_type:complete
MTKDYLSQAIHDADREFPGKKSAAPIMKFIASAESNYGNYNPETALSYGPFQIDPIRYYDIAQNPSRVKGAHADRIIQANEYLRTKLNNPDFDISRLATYNPETQGYNDVNLEMMRNPDVGAVLTRMALMQDPGELPDEEGLGSYYESFWGPKWSQSDNEDEKSQKRIDAQGRYDAVKMMDNVVSEQGSAAF